MVKHAQTILIFFFVTSLVSCDKNRIFEENIDIPSFEWKYENKIDFKIFVQDNETKNLLINFRHNQSFKSRNVRLNLEVKTPHGDIEKHALNVLLSEPNGMWYGNCSGDICTLQSQIKDFTQYQFKDTGEYVFSLSQDMRVNPLKHVLAVGLRLEKAEIK